MALKILFIGDIVGRPGRRAVKKLLPELKKKEKIDFVIANAENLSHGKGVTRKTVEDILDAGVDFCTSGNHIWKQREVYADLNDKKFPVIRPANYPPGVPGRGYQIVHTKSLQKILVINLMGRVFMKDMLDCPFRAADAILKEHMGQKFAAIFVDFHAEATSEKVCLGHYLTNRVTAVVGTHTHIPTADARILGKGTAYQTDAGAVCLQDSAIGVDKEPIIKHFLTQMPMVHEISDGPTEFHGTIVTVDPDTGRAIAIKPVHLTSD